jgi:hypothetical protein
VIWRAHWLELPIAAGLTVVARHPAFALGDTKVDAAQRGVPTGGNATNNIVTCNFGLTDEQSAILALTSLIPLACPV